jgi:dienelactone hydrolase
VRKGVLKAALVAADLRIKCKGYANQINKGAVCGADNLVTCGLFDEDARKPITCKAKKPGACVDKRGAVASACADETHCRDVIDWTASTCFDTRRKRAVRPGRAQHHVHQAVRGGPQQMRALNTSIWYPAPPGSAPINGQYAAVVDAPLDGSDGPYPLVMFSHGSCGYPQQSLFLTAFLATHGFIVVAPPHPGNTIGEFPTCGISRCRPPPCRAPEGHQLRDRPDARSRSGFGLAVLRRDRRGPHRDDGHSFGGLTTFLVARDDARIKVAVPMAPATPPNASFTLPSLLMLGQIDSVVNFPPHGRLRRLGEPQVQGRDQARGHYAFSGGCFPGPDCSRRAPHTARGAGARPPLVLPFLKVYLVGDTSLAPLLASPAPPSVDLTSAP